MKKGLIFATTLAMALGVGVAVGAHQNKAAKVEAADPVVLYCQMDYSWWTTDGAAIAVHYWGGETSTEWPGIRGTKVTAETEHNIWKFSVPSDSEHIIFLRRNPSDSDPNNQDWGAQTKTLDLPSDDKNLFTISNSTETWGGTPGCDGSWSKYVEPTPTPVDPNYYLKGDFNNWTVSEDYKFAADPNDSNHYVLEHVVIAAGQGMKGFKAENDWYGVAEAYEGCGWTVGTGKDAGNCIVTNADTYTVNLYVHSDNGNHLTISSETPVVSHEYKYSLNGAAGVVMTQNEQEGKESEYLSAELSFKKGDTLTFTKDNAAYAVSPKEDAQYTKVYVDDNKLVFAEDYNGSICLETNGDLLWAGQFTPGYYLAGLGGEWNPKLAMPATSGPNDDGAYYFGGINFVANTEIKALEFPNDNSSLDNHWLNADPTKVTADEGITWEVVSEGEGAGNLKIKTAGTTYGVYVNPTSGYYSLVDEQEHVYTVKVNDTVYELELNSGSEYKIKDEIAIELNSGDVVKVLKDGVEAAFARKKIGNNNLDAEYKVIANAEEQIYVDLSAKTVFVGGLDFGGYHVLHGGNYVHMTQNLEPLDPSFREYYTQMISFKKDEEVRFIDTSAVEGADYAVIFDITKINESSEAGIAVVGEEEAARLVVQKDVNLAVYIKLKTNNDEVYFGSVSPALAAAKEFAENFNDDMESVCVYNNKDITPSAALVSIWGEQVEAFDALPEQVQNILKAATTHDTINEIAEFVEKYEYIAGKYGDDLGEGYNFLEKDIQSSILFNGGLSSIMGSESSNVMIIVISIAATSALAFGMFLVFKKRKQK